MTNEISRMFFDPDTGLPQVFESMSEKDAVQALSDVQFLRAKIAAKVTAEAAKQTDLAEMTIAKADAALQDIKDDLTAVNAALTSWSTATNAQKIDMIQLLLQGHKRSLLRQQGIIKALKWKVNG